MFVLALTYGKSELIERKRLPYQSVSCVHRLCIRLSHDRTSTQRGATKKKIAQSSITCYRSTVAPPSKPMISLTNVWGSVASQTCWIKKYSVRQGHIYSYIYIYMKKYPKHTIIKLDYHLMGEYPQYTGTNIVCFAMACFCEGCPQGWWCVWYCIINSSSLWRVRTNRKTWYVWSPWLLEQLLRAPGRLKAPQTPATK